MNKKKEKKHGGSTQPVHHDKRMVSWSKKTQLVQTAENEIIKKKKRANSILSS